jgi:hypothetical protein
VFAQLRDVLAAKDSPVVPQEYHNGRLPGPQRAETNRLPVAIGKGDFRQPAAERSIHGPSIFGSLTRTVKSSGISDCAHRCRFERRGLRIQANL